MNEKQKDRRQLRNRMQRAQEVIFRRKGYRPSIAKKMAREFTDKICKQVKNA